jgi:hypothetical protein
VFGAGSLLQWCDEEYVERLFGERVESLELGRRRSPMNGFTDDLELRDFLKANHPVVVAMYRDPELARDPELESTLDDVCLGMINLWYARDGGEPGSFAQEAVFIVARRRAGAG